MTDHTVGIDIGGTSTEAVVVDADGRLAARRRVPTSRQAWPTLLAETCDVVRVVLADAGVSEVAAAGVGIPGLVDIAAGTVSDAANLAAFTTEVAVGPELSAALGTQVVLDNDVRAGALEALHLAASRTPGVRDVVYLSIGTGVAAGIVIDGQPLRGPRGLAGDIGHTPILGGTERCGCGLTGCLETRISGPALARRWPVSEPSRSATALFEAAEGGDADAERIVEEFISDMQRVLHWIFHTTGTHTVVLGGGVSTAHASILPRLQASMADLATRSAVVRRWASPERLMVSPSGHPTGALGAARMARRHLVEVDRHGRTEHVWESEVDELASDELTEHGTDHGEEMSTDLPGGQS